MKHAGQALVRAYRVVIGLLLATVLSVGLSACTALPGPARDEDLSTPRAVAFEGLISPDPGRPRTRYIFQIHGMNSPGFAWGQALLTAISASGYDLQPKEGQAWTPARLAVSRTVRGRDLVCDPPHADCRFEAFGKYRKDVFVNHVTAERVVVFSYSWRDDLWSITGHYVKPDIQDNTLAGLSTAHSLANAFVKVNVVDEGFSDAVGYLSNLGGLEREGIETTICAMLADATGVHTAPYGEDCLTKFTPADIRKLDQTEINFLSHSLGSRMIYDVLSGVVPETGQVRRDEQLAVRTALRRRTHTLIMAANQMPLLAASEFWVEPSPQATRGAETSSPQPTPEPVTPAPQPTLEALTPAPQPTPDALTPSSQSTPEAETLSPQPTPEPVTPAPQLTLQPTPEAVTLEPQQPLGFIHLKAPPHSGAAPVYSSGPTLHLTVIAFQDPDDLLGFKASDAVFGAHDDSVTFVDVLHRNTPQWAFLFADPRTAHDHELEEPHSLQMILCGADAGPDGWLKARDCRRK